MASGLLFFLVDCAGRTAILLGCAWALTTLLRRASASIRHRIWACAIIVVAVVPVTIMVVPRWHLPTPHVVASLAVRMMPAAGNTRLPESPAATHLPLSEGAANAEQPMAGSPQVPAATIGARYAQIATGVWVAGTVAVLLYLIASVLYAWRLKRSAIRLDASWTDEAQLWARSLRIRIPILLAESAETSVPIVCGLWRPLILLPRGAARWPLDRLRVVLLHEFAHIKRRDHLIQPLAQSVCALYWFNPLAWVAARALRIECERACDDVVLNAGTKGSDYARHLVEIARSLRLDRLSVPALSISHSSHLEARLIAILDQRMCRSSGVRARLAVTGAMLLISIPVTVITLTPAPSSGREAASPSSVAHPTGLTPEQRRAVDERRWATISAYSAPSVASGVVTRRTTPPSDVQWSGNLAEGETLEVRGVGGLIRTMTATDEQVHVHARIRDPARIRVDVLQRESGITICAVLSTREGERSECQPSRREAGLQDHDGRVDFVVQVPPGVRFAASMIHGNIELHDLRSDVIAATISGNIAVRLSRNHGAEFSANLISGTIDSDVPLYDSTPSLPPGHGVAGLPPPRIVRTTMGNGGPAFRLATISGNIRLRQY